MDPQKKYTGKRADRPPSIFSRNQAVSYRSVFVAERRGGLIIFSVAIAIILVIVVVGVCVSILLDGIVANVILLALIALLLVVGLLSFLMISRLNRQAATRRERSVRHEWSGERAYDVEPTAPPMSQRSSWALIKAWRYSKRSTTPRS